jgi:alcohol dehydrogenase, propanol-preferring
MGCMMRAQILAEIGPIESRPLRPGEIPIPEPGPGQVRVRVAVCGACHTELDQVEGRLASARPVVPGHQVVGRVDAIGSGATGLTVGDRVGVAWIFSACGACRFCHAGLENLCRQAQWTGKEANGGYAEWMVVPAESAYRIPERFGDLEAAPLLCAGVIGYRAFRLAGLQDGETLALYGFGASAHIVIQVAKHCCPASRIVVFTRGEAHRRLATRLGADWAGTAEDTPPVYPDKAIDFTPSGEIVRAALEALQPGGRLVINAIRKAGPIPPLDYGRHLWEEKEVKSVANVTRRDAREFLALAAAVPIVPEAEEFPLDAANEVLIRLKASEIKGAAVLRVATWP